MAKLVEYESSQSAKGLSPSDKGVSATEQSASANERAASTELAAGRQQKASLDESGRALGGAISNTGPAVAGAYTQFVAQPEISKGAAVASTIQDKLTKRWNELSAGADPNDTSISDKFRGEMDTELQKFKDGFNTKEGSEFADKQVNAFREHMYGKTTADMAVRAGQALKVNMATTVNNLSNMVRTDPSSYDHAVDMMQHSVGTLIQHSPGIDGDTANAARTTMTQEMKTQIAKAAILGTAERSPAAAKAMLDSGKFNDVVDGVEMSSMIKTMTRMQRADVDRDRVLKDRAEKDLSESTRDDYIKQLYTPGTKVSMQDIVTDNKLQPADREHLLNVVKGQMKPEAATVTSRKKTVELFTGIQNGQITDLTPVAKAFGDGDLTKADFDWVTKQFNDDRTPEGLKLSSVKRDYFHDFAPQITKSNPLMGKMDPSGDEQVYLLRNAVEAKIAEYRKTGKNVYDLFKPGTPDYVGSPQFLAPYKKDLSASLATAATRITSQAAPTPALPNPAPAATPPQVPISGRPEGYPADAEQGADGNWYVRREGKRYRVKNKE